jgi:hypothetical protein
MSGARRVYIRLTPREYEALSYTALLRESCPGSEAARLVREGLADAEDESYVVYDHMLDWTIAQQRKGVL